MTNTRLIHSHSHQRRQEPRGILQDEGNTSLAFVSTAGSRNRAPDGSGSYVVSLWRAAHLPGLSVPSLHQHYVFIRELSRSQTAPSGTPWRIKHLERGFVEMSLSHSSDIYHLDLTQLSYEYINCENPVVGLHITILRNFWQTDRKRNLTRDLKRLIKARLSLRLVWWLVFGGCNWRDAWCYVYY